MTLKFDADSRVMIVAPHPDDETLATGGLLQHVRQAGGAVRIVFVTSGDNNPWAQRAMERRWRIGPEDSARFARIRKEEISAALAVLGAEAGTAVFLGYPDQGITKLLVQGRCKDIVERFAELVQQWQPSHVVYPSGSDIHPDHSATYILLNAALAGITNDRPRCFEYVVHSRARNKRFGESVRLELSKEQQAKKLAAILCHKSQLTLRPRSLTARARDYEEFFCTAGAVPETADHPVRRCTFTKEHLELELAMRASIGAFGGSTIYLSAISNGMIAPSLEIELKTGIGKINNGESVFRLGDGITYRGNGSRGKLSISRNLIGTANQRFVKLKRRFGFFDEAGWREIPVY